MLAHSEYFITKFLKHLLDIDIKVV
jgi:hypothetical protein